VLILHVAESFAGGTFEVVRTLARYQRDAGHRVAIAYRVLPETPVPLSAAIASGVELIELRWKHRRPLSTALAAYALRRHAQRLRPDVAHLHSAFAGIAGALALPGLVPTVYTPHGHSIAITTGGGLRIRLRTAGERLIARRVDVVGAVSETEAALQREVVGRGEVVVVPNGIPELDDPPGRSAASEARPRPLAVAMGRITLARQPLGAGRILAGVSDVADVLWIGGVDSKDGVDVPGLPVTGWLDRDRALERLSEATALVHWSAWDSHPLVVLEAMAHDVVVIASDIPANRELLGGDQVFSRVEDATEALRRGLASPAAREVMLANQRLRRRRFSARQMSESWLSLYSSLGARAPYAPSSLAREAP
jgi:glycosyltransferase involved in cell wall biosynthesis